MQVAATLDALKAAGFHWATRSGVTIAIDDVVTPPRKYEILDRYERDAEKIEKQYQRGVITDDERRQELIEIWTKATSEVAREMEANFPRTNPVWIMVNSGARGNMMQMRQIAGMRGLVANPKGEIIPRPIKTTSARPDRPEYSSPPTVPARASRTRRCGPRTRATSPAGWSTSRRT